ANKTVKGQLVACLITTVFPAKMAGIERLKVNIIGEFHGEIIAVTPLGRFLTCTFRFLSPLDFGFHQSDRMSAPPFITSTHLKSSFLASTIGLPFSLTNKDT